MRSPKLGGGGEGKGLANSDSGMTPKTSGLARTQMEDKTKSWA